MDNMIFRNPRIKFRSEEFGGIVKTDKGLFLLNHEAYNLLKNANIERSESFYEEIIHIVEKLLSINAIIKISEEDVKCIKQSMNLNP